MSKTVEVKRIIVDGSTRAELYVNGVFIQDLEIHSQLSFNEAKESLFKSVKL